MVIFIKWIKDILSLLPWKWIILFLAIILSYYSCYRYGIHTGKKVLEEKQKVLQERLQEVQVELSKKQTLVSTEVVKDYKEKLSTLGEKYAELLESSKTNPPVTCSSNRFRVLHDEASNPQISQSTSGINETAPTIEAVTRTVIENYAICNVNKLRLEQLQQWIREQYKIQEETCKKPGVQCITGSNT
jgi:hypothetical protein